MSRNSSHVTATSLAASPPTFTRQLPGCTVVVMGGADAGEEVEVRPETVVSLGSGADCDLTLRDSAVSRRHLEIRAVSEGVELIDLGSKNGSFVGASRFEKLIVGTGTVFSIGQSLLKVLPNEAALDPAGRDGDLFGALVGGSAVMRKLYTLIEQTAASDVSVLIEGETGTGKELVAEEIHRRSVRRDAPLGVVDCGAVPDDLIESMLFGHLKGSFTGASNARTGVFPHSQGGTVFLDEIGELKLDLQPALLRVIDKGQVRAVGASTYSEVDVRIIGASHRNLASLIFEDLFREDLYYRIAVVRLTIPPLRERVEDLAPLVEHFLGRMGRSDLGLSPGQLEKAVNHSWPGNVRELRNAVERAVAFQTGGELDLLDQNLAPPPARMRVTKRVAAKAPSAGPGLTETSFREGKARAIEEFEVGYLTELMNRHESVTAAAAEAEMDRKHLRVLLKRHGLSVG